LVNGFASKLKFLRSKMGITQAKLASDLGVGKSTISMYEVGAREPDFVMLEAIADYFNVDMNFLTGWNKNVYDYEADPENRLAEIPSDQFDNLKKIYKSNFKAIWEAWQVMKCNKKLPSNAIPYSPSNYHAPILGSIPAGYPSFTDENVEGWASIDYPDPENYFWLRVKGDSMVNAGISTGDLVLIRLQPCADDGDIVACRVNGDEATLKRYRRHDDSIMLIPENSMYAPQVVHASEFENGYASILGIAVEIRKLIR